MVNEVDTSGIVDFDEIRKDLESAIGPFDLVGVNQTSNGHVLRVVQDGAEFGVKFARGSASEGYARTESIRKESAALQALGSELTHGQYRAAGRQGETEYLVTRWTGGISLSDVCRPLRADGKHAAIAAECMAASRPVRALHAAGWVHGDLQPAHCIQVEGKGYQLIDFGWAKKEGADNGYRGAMIHFASARVASQMRAGIVPVEYTTSDEVFAFVAVTFFCLYGKPIWYYNGVEGRVGLERGLNFIVNNDHDQHILDQTGGGPWADFFIAAVRSSRDGQPMIWSTYDHLLVLPAQLRTTPPVGV